MYISRKSECRLGILSGSKRQISIRIDGTVVVMRFVIQYIYRYMLEVAVSEDNTRRAAHYRVNPNETSCFQERWKGMRSRW